MMNIGSPPAVAAVSTRTEGGVYVNEQQLAAQAGMLPHYIHVPIFRQKKKIYVKKQYEGCCGALNTSGYCDNPGGFACFPFLNVDGCCDRDLIYRVDSDGNPLRAKPAAPRQWRHPWERSSEGDASL